MSLIALSKIGKYLKNHRKPEISKTSFTVLLKQNKTGSPFDFLHELIGSQKRCVIGTGYIIQILKIDDQREMISSMIIVEFDSASQVAAFKIT